jgi:zinc D-Ala-D-Ala dipeptidase
MKPYQQIPIVECGEPLLPIPLEHFAIEDPHPYVKLGAPYGDKSPYYLRQSVLERLVQAQARLQQAQPNWKIQIFDAYRPIAVQQYMVDYTFAETLRAKGLQLNALTETQHQSLLEQVYQFWAVPSSDPRTPPPHSTGSAIDVTLVDAAGQTVDMGSPIDEMSARSHPNYFVEVVQDQDDPLHSELTSDRVRFQTHRQILADAMTSVGFCQHPREWWHFSLGDQLWAWLMQQKDAGQQYVARYGSIT